ncbi:MAG: hypothetical protein ACI84D_003884, partial [Thalassolituus oleivorans]
NRDFGDAVAVQIPYPLSPPRHAVAEVVIGGRYAQRVSRD